MTDAAPRFDSATVMVVDDQEANLALLDRLLRVAGVRDIILLSDGREAVARCVERCPDLVLLDLHMPGMDGFEVLELLHTELPADAFVPILVLTADLTTVTRDRALRAGAKDFLTKPFDRTEVLLRVGNLLETRSLYGALAERNAQLRATLDQQLAEERRQAVERQQVLDEVEAIIRDGHLYAVFQPIADLSTGAVVGVEALGRFATHLPRSPEQWFADARAVGLDTSLELRAIEAALEQLPALAPELFLAVCLSPEVLVTREAAELFAGVDVRRIVIELNEHGPVDDYDRLLAALDGLRYRGARLAMDDTGAGYAGLEHMLRLLPDVLKLDGELIRAIDQDPVRRSLAAALVSFAAEIGATIVAEGIETPQEVEALRRLDVTWGQGFHLARPGALPLASPTIAVLQA